MKTPGRSLVAAQLLGWTGFAVLFALLSIPALPHPSLASELALANSVGKIDLLRDGSNTTAAIPAATAAGTGTAP